MCLSAEDTVACRWRILVGNLPTSGHRETWHLVDTTRY